MEDDSRYLRERQHCDEPMQEELSAILFPSVALLVNYYHKLSLLNSSPSVAFSVSCVIVGGAWPKLHFSIGGLRGDEQVGSRESLF